jgi:hypothetical protein
MEPIEWIYLIVVLVLAAYAYSKRPKPVTPEAQTSQAPQVQDGTRIIKWYGINWMDDSMVLAWKQDGTEPIRSSGGKK